MTPADCIPLAEAYITALKFEPRNAAEQEFKRECSVGLARLIELEELLDADPVDFPPSEL